MAWEQRKNGREYYYRALRKGSRVTKVYLGAGEKGRKAAEADQAARDSRWQATLLRQEENKDVDDVIVQLNEFGKLVDLLMTCHLVCAGFRQHNRQWRPPTNGRRRNNRNA